MMPAARLSAAMEVLQDIQERRRPAPDALKDWGLARRFAGSKDRAAVASLVYDALRRKASSAHVMQAETPRALVLAMLIGVRKLNADEIGALCTGTAHAPEPLSETEAAQLAAFDLASAPDWVQADAPEWLWPSIVTSFGGKAIAEMQALATRAFVDVRANTLKQKRSVLRGKLQHLSPEDTPWSPDGLRFAVGEDGRGPALQAEQVFFEGGFEIQDEGSQLVTQLSGTRPGMTVVDLCAGAGGKTLALAALMQNEGTLIASDLDTRRLAPLHDRLARSGATCVDIRAPKGRGHDALADLDGTADLVLVDAPCTGSGTWRRNPDAKWRVRPGALTERLKDQATVLARAARLVKPGGRIAYITCSVLADENDGAVAAFLARHAGFRTQSTAELIAQSKSDLSLLKPFATQHGLQLSPLRTGTDGFYLAGLVQRF